MKIKESMVKKSVFSLMIVLGLFIFSCNKDKKQVSENAEKITSGQHKAEENLAKDSSEKFRASNQHKTDSTKSIHTAVEGRFVAENCENGRFSIVITRLNGRPVFKVYDDTKVILSGKAEVSTTSSNEINIIMGNMGGLYADGVLTIQNYGNSMNEFENFTQCEDKYLAFTKQ